MDKKLIRNIMMISLFFSAVTAAVLLLNYMQLATSEPVDSPSLEALRTELSMDNTNTQLREQIRDLDLMIRKAYFIKKSQLRIGGFILIAGLVVFCICANILYFRNRHFPKLEEDSPSVSADKESLNNYLLTAGGVAIVAIAGVFALIRGEQAITGAVASDSKQKQIAEAPPAITFDDLAANWVAFRGVDGSAQATRNKVPTEWDEASNKNITWKIKSPLQGYNSPIVWNDKIFITGGDDKKRAIFCYNEKDGSLVWEHDTSGIVGSPTEQPEVTEDTGFAAATMATDGQRVFAIFANGDLVATDMGGKRIWARNLGVPENSYGHSSSLITYEDLLYVQYYHAEEQFLLALNTATGKPIWKASPEEEGETAWSTPVIARHDEGASVIISTVPWVVSYDARSGKKQWQHECMGGELGSSPAVGNGMVYAANDGASLYAMDLKTGKELWVNEDISMPDAASPVCIGDYLIISTAVSELICVNAKTGETVWEQETDADFYSSPIAVNGKVYVSDMKGVTHVIEPGPEYKNVGTYKLKEGIVAIPAFANGAIYMRGYKHLYKIGGGQ